MDHAAQRRVTMCGAECARLRAKLNSNGWLQPWHAQAHIVAAWREGLLEATRLDELGHDALYLLVRAAAQAIDKQGDKALRQLRVGRALVRDRASAFIACCVHEHDRHATRHAVLLDLQCSIHVGQLLREEEELLIPKLLIGDHFCRKNNAGAKENSVSSCSTLSARAGHRMMAARTEAFDRFLKGQSCNAKSSQVGCHGDTGACFACALYVLRWRAQRVAIHRAKRRQQEHRLSHAGVASTAGALAQLLGNRGVVCICHLHGRAISLVDAPPVSLLQKDQSTC